MWSTKSCFSLLFFHSEQHFSEVGKWCEFFINDVIDFFCLLLHRTRALIARVVEKREKGFFDFMLYIVEL